MQLKTSSALFFGIISLLVISPFQAMAQTTSADEPIGVETSPAAPPNLDTPQPAPNGTIPATPPSTMPPATLPATPPAPGPKTPENKPAQSRANERSSATAQNPQASTSLECSNNVAFIFDDVTKRSDPKNKKYNAEMPWKDLAWLEKSFGIPSGSTTIPQTIIHWDNYNVIVRNNRINKTVGKYPGKNQPQDDLVPVFVGKATREIGPAKSVIKENLTQFIWTCADTSSSVSVLADNQGNILTISGVYCNDADGCRNFGTAVNDSTLTQKLQ